MQMSCITECGLHTTEHGLHGIPVVYIECVKLGLFRAALRVVEYAFKLRVVKYTHCRVL